MLLDSEFYNFLFYVIMVINIILTFEIFIQMRKILFIKKKLGTKHFSIPEIKGKIRITDIAIILIWLFFAANKIYSVITNPVGFYGNLDYLLILFAFLALIDRVISIFISNGFGTVSITFFYSDKGIVIYNPMRKMTQFTKINFLKWEDIDSIVTSIDDLSRRIWHFKFNMRNQDNYFVIFDDAQKNIAKKIIDEKDIKIID